MFKLFFVLTFFSLIAGCSPLSSELIIDDFEGAITKETVDFGAGNGAFVNVTAANDIFNSGKQAMKVDYKIVPSGYMWVARGYDLDVQGAASWIVRPEKIAWKKYGMISFQVYSEKAGIMIAVDMKDANKEMWRGVFKTEGKGWQKVDFTLDKLFARADWQPADAVVDGVLDYPIKSFQFEVKSPGEGTLYFDKVELGLIEKKSV